MLGAAAHSRPGFQCDEQHAVANTGSRVAEPIKLGPPIAAKPAAEKDNEQRQRCDRASAREYQPLRCHARLARASPSGLNGALAGDDTGAATSRHPAEDPRRRCWLRVWMIAVWPRPPLPRICRHSRRPSCLLSAVNGDTIGASFPCRADPARSGGARGDGQALAGRNGDACPAVDGRAGSRRQPGGAAQAPSVSERRSRKPAAKSQSR
jgi:hypothetical protein